MAHLIVFASFILTSISIGQLVMAFQQPIGRAPATAECAISQAVLDAETAANGGYEIQAEELCESFNWRGKQ